MNKQFDSAWKELSPIQREAANWDEGSLLVLAGPGSGKTRVLTCHTAHILDSSRGKNSRVLCLTFTNKAADEMRTRVASFVPDQEARLFLGTFHGFCADILRQHGTHLKINPNFKIYSQESDLQAVLNDAVEEAKTKSDLVSNNDKKTLPVIQRLKSMLVMPENCRDKFKDANIGARMAVVYPTYEAQLNKKNALDFNSLILKAYQLFTEFPNFAKRYRAIYPYICIDEFQDTNHAQYSLIRAITVDQHRNLFIVADDDQIIYQWNGASHKRLDQFLRDYTPRVIQLPVNYRCPPEIVNLANNLIRHNFLRNADKLPLEAFRLSDGKDVVRLLPRFPDFESEASGIAKDIKKNHSHEIGKVIVLARGRKLLDLVERDLRDAGIPAAISQRKDEFESTPFIWLNSILRLANDRSSIDALEAVCGTFFQLTRIEVNPDDVVTQARASNQDYLRQWIKLARQNATTASVKEVIEKTSSSLDEGRDFKTFIKFILEWFSRISEATDPPERDDPSAEMFSNYDEERSVWDDLTREIARSYHGELTLETFLQELQMHSKEPIPKPDAVVLMTIHGAKGKEFDHVYVVGLVDDELPSFQSKKKGDNSPEMEEERRNCFVAITRTMKTLTLSYGERYRGWKKEPSRFLFEMGLLQ